MLNTNTTYTSLFELESNCCNDAMCKKMGYVDDAICAHNRAVQETMDRIRQISCNPGEIPSIMDDEYSCIPFKNVELPSYFGNGIQLFCIFMLLFTIIVGVRFCTRKVLR